MKTDARSRYTTRIIRECFFELLKDTPLNKITVKRLCEKAEINRSTFYRYYNDAFDLMRHIEDDLMASFEEYAKEIRNDSIEEAIEIMVNSVKSNKELYLILTSENADKSFINKMVLSSFEVFKEGFAKRYPKTKPIYHEWLYYFISHGCISVITHWIDNGMKENSKEITAFISSINQKILDGDFS